LAGSFILAPLRHFWKKKMNSFLQGVRNVLLASLEDMKETEHFQIS
jgi:hypothetical protein